MDPEQAHLQRRLGGDVEPVAGQRGDPLAQLGAVLGVEHRHGGRGHIDADHHLARPLRVGGIQGTQTLVPVDHVGERGAHGVDVQLAGEPQRHCDVVGGRGRIHAVEHPHALLRGDSGTRSGRIRGASANRPGTSPVAGTTRVDSWATVGASNRSRSAIRDPSPAFTRATTLVALNELPPSSKNDWSTLTRSLPSTSQYTAATASSTGVRGAR